MPADRLRPGAMEASPTLAVSVEGLTALAIDLLVAAGVPAPAAQSVADALVAADLEGQASHGVMLLTLYLDRIAGGSVRPAGAGRVASDAGSAVVLDAEDCLGQVTAERAVALAVERARQHGLAAVAVRNAFHFGAAGRWARRMAEAGCVGIVLSNTRPLMPAPGGAEPVTGNNPLAIAVPADRSGPIVADLALSAGAMGRIRLAAANGEAIPPGWACDANGVATLDPGEAIRGMLLPAGGAKGFALAALVDVLAGGLSSGAIGAKVRPLYGDPTLPYRCSHLFLAIDIERFRPLEAFGAAVSTFAERVRGSRRAPDTAAVRMPGDRAAAARERDSATCLIARSTLDALLARAQAAGIALPATLMAQ